MTPTFCWVFLLVLALVGRAASVPRPIVVDACALLCNPGAETESERERDPILFPRYPKVNCRLQSKSDEHQTFALLSHCLKLCASELSIASEVNCFALRSSLEASIGCYCEALTPLSPNTMRLHESWRLNFLVKELAKDVLSTILDSPLDVIILCEIHEELFKNADLSEGLLVNKCKSTDSAENFTVEDQGRSKRFVEGESDPLYHQKVTDDKLQHDNDENMEIVEIDNIDDIEVAETVHQEKLDESIPIPIENLDSLLRQKKAAEGFSHQDQDNPILGEDSEMKQSCQKVCKKADPSNNEHCQCII